MLLLSQDKKEQRVKIRNIFWDIAKTAKERDGSFRSKCDYCSKNGLAYLFRVFHTIDKKRLFTKRVDKKMYLLTDHVTVCKDCKDYLPSVWVSCRCKKDQQNKNKGEICQV